MFVMFFWGHTFEPIGFAKLRHVTISMHVHVTHLHCLLCFRSSGLGYVAGKYLVLECAHNGYNRTHRSR